jgi:hypothetical protein
MCQQRSVAAPAGPVVPLPNNNLAKDNRNSLTKVCMHLSLSPLNKTRCQINLQKEENSGGKGAASGGAQNREAARKSRLRKKVSHSTKTLTCTTLRNHTVQLCKVQGTTKTFIWYPPSHIYTNIYPREWWHGAARGAAAPERRHGQGRCLPPLVWGVGIPC